MTSAAFLSLAAGCNGGSTTTDAATDTGPSDMGTSDATGDVASDTPANDTGGSDAGAPSCSTYCTAIMANCTAGNQQYTTMTNCMNSCMAFAVGTSADTSGDTLGCRVYHAMAAMGDPMTHCPHAGPGGAGVCGSNCTGYCDIAMHFCTGANQIYMTRDECMLTCMSTPDTARFNVTDTTLQDRDIVACLLYHVQEGSTAPADHCLGDLIHPDGGVADAGGSVTCSMP